MALSEFTTTARGREFAWKLNPYIGTTREIEQTCSRIARAEATLHRLAEELCNGYTDWHGNWDGARAERAEAQIDRIEARVRDLVSSLPTPDDGPWHVTFQHDPRGRIVILTAPDGRELSPS